VPQLLCICITYVAGSGFLICYQPTRGGANNAKLVAIGTINEQPQVRNNRRIEHRIGGQVPITDTRLNAEQHHVDELEYTLPDNECIAGCQLDEEGCVLLISSDGHHAKLQLLRPRPWSPARELLEIKEPNPGQQQV
jgi:hypothetical protein